MTAFDGSLKSEFIPYRNEIILTDDLTYDCLRTKQRYVVPCGFISDCASIPRFAWRIIGHPFDHRWRKESVLHDWFYRMPVKIVSRRMADQIFYDGLRGQGLGYAKAQIMYQAVRVGGWNAWRKSLRDDGAS